MSTQTIEIKSPLVIIYEAKNGKIETAIHRHRSCSRYEHFGMLICDLVRHVAKAFHVSEDDVWKWVEKERRKPTTELTGESVQ